MLLLLLITLLFQFKLFNCLNDSKAQTFNETQLTEQLHRSLLKVNEYLKHMQRNIHNERSALRAIDYEDMAPRGQDFMNYDLTEIWWNGTQKPGQNTRLTSFFPPYIEQALNGTSIWTSFRTRPYSTPLTYIYSPDYTEPGYVPQFTYGPPSAIPLHPDQIPSDKTISRPSMPFPITTEMVATPWNTPSRSIRTTTGTTTTTTATTTHVLPWAFTPEKKTNYPWPSLKNPDQTTTESTYTFINTNPSLDYVYPDPAFTLKETLSPKDDDGATTKSADISRYVDAWLKVVHANKSADGDDDDWLANKQIGNNNLTEEIEPKIGISNKQLNQNASEYLAPSIHRQGPPVPPSTTLDPVIATATVDPWMPTGTQIQEQFIIENPDGFLSVGTPLEHAEITQMSMLHSDFPTYLPPSVEAEKTTKPGDVMYGEVRPMGRNDSYVYNMLVLAEKEELSGMMLFLLTLTELVATKDPADVYEVVKHAEPITIVLFERGRLAWFGEPLIQVVMNLGIFISETGIDVVQSYAAMMHEMLKDRKESLAVDVNSIIDYAELLYEEAEEILLYKVLEEFYNFPNITKSSYDLADDLIEHFLVPFRRLYNSERRQRLLDSINLALKQRFPRFDHRKSNVGQDFFMRKEQTSSTRQLRRQNIKTRQLTKENWKRKSRAKQRQRNDIKKMRHKPELHSEFNYENRLRRKYNMDGDIYPQLRRTKGSTYKKITNLQKRFSIITSGKRQKFRGIMTESYTNPSNIYVNLAAIRPTTDYRNIPSNFFHDTAGTRSGYHRGYNRLENQNRVTPKSFRDKVTSFLNEMKKRFIKSQDKRQAAKMMLKEKIIKHIAQGSSYSDEEKVLKMNLIGALLRNNTDKFEEGAVTIDSQIGMMRIRFDRPEASLSDGEVEENMYYDDKPNGI